MPLTPSKYQHIQNKIAALDEGRVQTITLALKQANGSVTPLAVQGIFRLAADGDPTLGKEQADAVMQIHAKWVTLSQLRGCVYVSPPAGSVAYQLATRYLITAIVPKGIGPDPDRYICTLDRQR